MKSIQDRASLVCLLALLIMQQLVAQSNEKPFSVDTTLFDFSRPETLGLNFAPGTETFTIFKPGEIDNKYNHAVVLFPYEDYLYAQWQTSATDEDAPDTRVVYSRSKDGEHWCKPMELVPEWDKGIKTSGGWWSNGDMLVAYINVWPNQPDKPKGGYVEYKISTDGLNWTEVKRLMNKNDGFVNGIIEQDLHALPDGRIITAVHEQPGLIVSPYYTDDPLGTSGWTKGQMENLPHGGFISRELEPSWYYRSDGAVVMIFRDQQSSFKKLASVSYDRGETWSKPVITDMPDSRAKQCAGNLPDGTAYQVNNPSGNKTRYPLMIILSKDGKYFDKAFLLRSGGEDLQPMCYEGKYKRVGYSYPKSVLWDGYLYVSYATNKEDVEVTRVKIDL